MGHGDGVYFLELILPFDELETLAEHSPFDAHGSIVPLETVRGARVPEGQRVWGVREMPELLTSFFQTRYNPTRDGVALGEHAEENGIYSAEWLLHSRS